MSEAMDDRGSIQAVIDELYALVSGPGDRARDWGREAELFLPDARMIRTVIDGDGQPRAEFIAVANYPANFEAKMGGRDFYEVELCNRIEIFGCIAQVFSSYEAFADAERQIRLKRGINSIQFYKLDGRWRISAMVWDDERAGLEMPARYLPR
ncbi:hypothetical protein [Wenzhouxiangella marina]|uniref:Uncharacterized protein n=1 Tax=Wenzhouxiangella marina TaxID=1579979 RepID=A0A0K0Y0C9_9GAMM|nr:hypothetical protein [Wenzhouxiangella marina]AKS43375.1 hypothetical protein WM2015_3023 [Wenzhouxiangella marina]MBB6088509.1 hypothetical protein [Wenzhouxiangella marina]